MIYFACYDIWWWNNILPIVEECIKRKINYKLFAWWASKKILKNANISFDNINKVNLIPLNDTIKIVFTWTSYPNENENILRKRAKQAWIKTIAILDNWGRIYDRFNINWVISIESIPDIYLLIDIYAKDIALKDEYSKYSKLCVTWSPYLEKTINSFNLLDNIANPINILFISAEYKKQTNTDEFVMIEDLYSYFLKYYKDKGYNFLIKLHPKEMIGKYNEWIKSKNDLSIWYVDRKLNNNEVISSAVEVWWCDSIFLMEACLMWKKVLSYQPIVKWWENSYSDWLIANKLWLTNMVDNRDDLMNNKFKTKKHEEYKIVTNSIENIFYFINKYYV